MLEIENNQEFEKEVLKSKEVILVDFFVTWCPPCQMLAPVLEKISESRAGYNIAKINVDNNQELAIKYEVEAVPTMIIFKEGKIVNRLVGYSDEEKIIEEMSKINNQE